MSPPRYSTWRLWPAAFSSLSWRTGSLGAYWTCARALVQHHVTILKLQARVVRPCLSCPSYCFEWATPGGDSSSGPPMAVRGVARTWQDSHKHCIQYGNGVSCQLASLPACRLSNCSNPSGRELTALLGDRGEGLVIEITISAASDPGAVESGYAQVLGTCTRHILAVHKSYEGAPYTPSTVPRVQYYVPSTQPVVSVLSASLNRCGCPRNAPAAGHLFPASRASCKPGPRKARMACHESSFSRVFLDGVSGGAEVDDVTSADRAVLCERAMQRLRRVSARLICTARD